MSAAEEITPSVARNPWTRSKSSPGVRMVTASGVPASRISSGSSAATVSGRVLCAAPRMRRTGVRLVTLPTGGTLRRRAAYRRGMQPPLPPYAAGAPAVGRTPPPRPPCGGGVLAGGRPARRGGGAKPRRGVGGRPMLAPVLAAVADAEPRIVVGPPQPVPQGVVVVREDPPRGG